MIGTATVTTTVRSAQRSSVTGGLGLTNPEGGLYEPTRAHTIMKARMALGMGLGHWADAEASTEHAELVVANDGALTDARRTRIDLANSQSNAQAVTKAEQARLGLGILSRDDEDDTLASVAASDDLRRKSRKLSEFSSQNPPSAYHRIVRVPN